MSSPSSILLLGFDGSSGLIITLGFGASSGEISGAATAQADAIGNLTDVGTLVFVTADPDVWHQPENQDVWHLPDNPSVWHLH